MSSTILYFSDMSRFNIKKDCLLNSNIPGCGYQPGPRNRRTRRTCAEDQRKLGGPKNWLTIFCSLDRWGTNNHAIGGWRTKDILGGPKSLETKKLGSSKGWEDQSAEKTNNWKDKKYITNRWDTKKLNILLKTETTVHCEIIHLWRGNLVCMCSYPC